MGAGREGPGQGVPPKVDVAPPPRVVPGVISPSEIDEFVTDLQSPEFRVRDEATRRLQTDDRATLSVLEGVLRDRGSGMTLEGRERLMSIARERFDKSPRGAMGIGFGGREEDTGVKLPDRVIVGQTYEGFESFRLLERGDIISAAEGQELHGSDAQLRMQGIIVSHDPGDVIALVVRRGKQKLLLNVRLRSFNDLPNSVIDLNRLNRAWRYRTRAIAPQAAEPVKFAVQQDDWEKPVRDAFPRGFRRPNRQVEEHQLPAVAGGGVARGEFPEVDDGRLGQQWVILPGNGNGRNIQAQLLIGPGSLPESGRAPLTYAQELKELSMARQRETTNNRGRGDAADAEVLHRLALIQKQEDAIRAEMVEKGESMPDLNAGRMGRTRGGRLACRSAREVAVPTRVTERSAR